MHAYAWPGLPRGQDTSQHSRHLAQKSSANASGEPDLYADHQFKVAFTLNYRILALIRPVPLFFAEAGVTSKRSIWGNFCVFPNMPDPVR
jgi:hypothetical protein